MNDTRNAVIQAVNEHPGAMSALFLAQLLKGNQLPPLVKKGLTSSPWFGALKDALWTDVDTAIADCLTAGLIAKVAGPYAALAVTQAGAAAVQSLQLAAKAEETEGLALASPDERFAAYHRWRKAEAQRQGKPPYRLMTNNHLNALARICPTTLSELLLVPGFGKVRVMRYQGALLAIGEQFRPTQSPAAAGE